MTIHLVPAYRIVTFVPAEHLEKVRGGVKQSDPLAYGKYTGVCWRSATGTEFYTPGEGSDPVEGRPGIESSVRSIRLEFSIPRDETILQNMLVELAKAHPWEEPVILVSEIMETRSR